MNWVQLKMESDSDIGQANIHWFGYIRCLDDIESTEKGLGNKEELNKLLYRQISISHSLLSCINISFRISRKKRFKTAFMK